jgi:hypothetical protein
MMEQDLSLLCFPSASQPISEVLPMPALQTAEVVRIPQRFSDTWVRRLKLPAGVTDQILWDPDLPGFGVRLRSTKTTYLVQYRFQKATQRESLGDVRKLNLDEARKVARQFFAKLELGMDPRDEKRKAEAGAEAARLTFKMVSDLYLQAKQAKMRPSTYKAADTYFNVKWAPLHRKPIATIDRKTVADQLRRIVSDHGPTSAARARSNLSALFAWAMKEGMVDVNPVIGTNNPIEGKQGRDRVLTAEEVRIVWRSCADDDFGRIVRLLLLTACRRDEIGWLRWREVDLPAEAGCCCRPNARSQEGRWRCPWLPRRGLSSKRLRGGLAVSLYLAVAAAGSAHGPGASWPSTAGSRPRREGLSLIGRCTTSGGPFAPVCQSSASNLTLPSLC